jgi:hypothetical protein
MQRWLRIKLNNLGKTILSYTDTVLLYKSISISKQHEENTKRLGHKPAH